MGSSEHVVGFEAATIEAKASAETGVCGTAPLHTRIVGGNTAAVGAWPWQVSLQVSGQHVCGGSLINNQWVLTAAQCLIGSSPSNYSVILGRDSLQSASPNEATRSVSRVIGHPDYHVKTLDNDIALVQLASSVTFTNYIRPVCLAADGSIFNAGSSCWVTGWGRIQTGVFLPPPERLQQVSIPIVSNQQCNEVYRMITDNMMCTGTSGGGTGTCMGDGGGPLVRKSDTKWVQGGVVSFVSAGGCALPHIPSGYARVSRYQSWINSQITTNQPGFVISGAAQLAAPLLLSVSLLLSSLCVLS
ncbi:chymotrypsin-like protease CTRL-1 [Pagrus major]|uniref:chymotrypsin-like protease CTRL-1 n=1 Tax=Pagrus major TaxID=143350 RepID=UPI003CC85525